jgi:hypothetical protein
MSQEHRCADLAAPCLHLNDGTCVQKTMNSESEFTVDHHCYLDRDAADKLYWKFGDWHSAKGKESVARGTLGSAGNTDCYCPAGMVDTSPKLLAELECIRTTEEAELLEHTNERKQFFYENQAVMVYDQACPDGAAPANAQSKKLEHSGPEGYSMCGQHFDGSGGAGSCYMGDSCLNDRIRCIRVGALTTATLYKHCNSVGDAVQMEYAMLDNSNDMTPSYFNLDSAYYDVSRIMTNAPDQVLGAWNTVQLLGAGRDEGGGAVPQKQGVRCRDGLSRDVHGQRGDLAVVHHGATLQLPALRGPHQRLREQRVQRRKRHGYLPACPVRVRCAGHARRTVAGILAVPTCLYHQYQQWCGISPQ